MQVGDEKFQADGTLERLKGKGCSQRPGFDYLPDKTYSPTPRPGTLRSTLARAAFEDRALRSVDISHAFINGELEEEIYMQQPEGYHFGAPGDVLHLRKSLYGLKQAGRVWNQTLHDTLGTMGSRLRSDASFYLYTGGRCAH